MCLDRHLLLVRLVSSVSSLVVVAVATVRSWPCCGAGKLEVWWQGCEC
jgi:hypothetical protein